MRWTSALALALTLACAALGGLINGLAGIAAGLVVGIGAGVIVQSVVAAPLHVQRLHDLGLSGKVLLVPPALMIGLPVTLFALAYALRADLSVWAPWIVGGIAVSFALYLVLSAILLSAKGAARANPYGARPPS